VLSSLSVDDTSGEANWLRSTPALRNADLASSNDGSVGSVIGALINRALRAVELRFGFAFARCLTELAANASNSDTRARNLRKQRKSK
jgi:hypothetical protein